ncbi:MAG: S41 family peptidase [Patescibacteria group bacterium]
MNIVRRFLLAAGGMVLLALFFGAGIYVGYKNRPPVTFVTSLFHKEEAAPAVDFGSFWQAWNIINEKYVSTNGPSDQEKVWGAIEGLAGSLGDPYTVFFPPTEAKKFESDISGEFTGVGMEIGMRDDVLTVIAPLKGTPAFRAGIMTGDKILEIDGKTTAHMTVDKAIDYIRGPKGTEVSLTILGDSDEEPRKIKIIRDVISVPTTDIEIRSRDGVLRDLPAGTGDTSEVFVITLYNFSAQSPELFRQALRQFLLSDKNKLILDLRGNPGGYLEAAVDMASWFLPPGKVVVREEFARGDEEKVHRSRGYNIFTDKLKMVILVDGGSASASEILAGALSEHGIATLVGTKTFGKGSVQELVPMTDDTALKVTVARWLTPNGVSISEQGLIPQVEIKLDKKEEKKETGKEKDVQLEKAIEILND